jgi:signal transduction histidine kinase
MTERMWRVAALYRVITMIYAAILIIRDHDKFDHPAAGIAAIAIIIFWTSVTVVAYSRPGGRRRWLLVIDVAVAAALVLSTRWIDSPARIIEGFPTLPSFWSASPVIACSIADGPWAGIAAALAIAAADFADRPELSLENPFSNVVLLLIVGGIGGYIVRLGVQAERAVARATGVEAATAERERIARGIHDSVLQVLTRVASRGQALGGEAAELGRMAAEQETALRRLVTGAALDPAVLNSAVLDPAVLDPAMLDPAVTDRAVRDPAVTEPAAIDPASTQAGLAGAASAGATAETSETSTTSGTSTTSTTGTTGTPDTAADAADAADADPIRAAAQRDAALWAGPGWLDDTGPDATGAGHPTDVRPLIERFGDPRVTVSCPADAVLLPTASAAALSAATAAALDNVGRHAGPQARAWVLVEDTGAAVRISIRDDGPGFAAGRLAQAAATGRLGVSHSIVGRVREVGGTACVTSSPGQGTEVELAIPRAGPTGTTGTTGRTRPTGPTGPRPRRGRSSDLA